MLRKNVPQEESEIFILHLEKCGYQIHSVSIDPNNFMNMIIIYSEGI